MCFVLPDSGQPGQQVEEATSARKDLEDSSKAIKSLEKQLKGVTQDKDDLHKVAFCEIGTRSYFHLDHI